MSSLDQSRTTCPSTSIWICPPHQTLFPNLHPTPLLPAPSTSPSAWKTHKLKTLTHLHSLKMLPTPTWAHGKLIVFSPISPLAVSQSQYGCFIFFLQKPDERSCPLFMSCSQSNRTNTGLEWHILFETWICFFSGIGTWLWVITLWFALAHT